ncbi:MAG: hypothetical protein HZB31_00430 [Nitrospirae bacterium]|nr:hypothetical protein [Nitrospirota bacterium]
MDENLRQLIELATLRGSNYVKGASTLEELPGKLAELGVLLLEKAKIMQHSGNGKLKDEVIELQNKIDDMRKTLFASKLLIK